MRRDERRCEHCFSEVEDATHLLLRCPVYDQLRLPALQALEALGDQEQDMAGHARALRLASGQDIPLPRDTEVETRMLQWLTDEEPELIMAQLRESLVRRKGLLAREAEEASDSDSDRDSGSGSGEDEHSGTDSGSDSGDCARLI
jgi:hypothetical protein